MIRDNLLRVMDRIEKACQRAGRQGREVQLVAVTKTVPVDRILEAVRCGVTDIGESRVQESQEKFQSLAGRAQVRRHLIGRLQRNKAGRAAEIFDCVQSLESARCAQALDRRAKELGKVLDCLIEVKASPEAAKGGVPAEDFEAFIESCRDLENLRLRGLMAIPPYEEDPEGSRPVFRAVRELFSKQVSHFTRPILSMGMSHDLEAAIQEGSTMVRVGRAIFGERPIGPI